MGIYNSGDDNMKNPIVIEGNNLKTNEPWEGHTLKEVESYVCSVFEKLSDTSSAKIALILPGGNLVNFVNGSSNIKFQYSVRYTEEGDNVGLSYKLRIENITTNKILFDDTIVDAVSEQINESIDISNTFKETTAGIVQIRVTAYVYDNEGHEKPSSYSTINYNRVAGSIGLSGMTFGQVNPANIAYSVNFNPTAASPKAYIRYRIIKPDGSYINFVDATTNTSLTYNEEAVDAAGIKRILLPNTITASGPYTIVASLIVGRTNNNVGIETQSVSYTFLYVDETLDDGTKFVVVDTPSSANQNDYATLRYLVHIKGADNSAIYPILLQNYPYGGGIVTQAIKNVRNNEVNTWKYFVPNDQNLVQVKLRFAIPKMSDGKIVYVSGIPQILEASDNDGIVANVIKQFNVNSTNVTWENINYTFDISAKNKSNTDYDVGTLKDGNYSLQFIDFQWNDNGSGYYQKTIDNVETTVLKFIGNSRAIVKHNDTIFTPFYNETQYNASTHVGGGILATGLTLKITFAVSNVSNSSIKVIDCYDEQSGYGFYVTGNGIYVKLGEELFSKPEEYHMAAGHNGRYFAENKRIELTIAVRPYQYIEGQEVFSDVFVYINGEIAAFRNLSQTALRTLTQTIAKGITFGGSGAILYLYDIKYANSYANSFQVLQDYGLGLDSSEALNTFYEKNSFYELDTSGKPVLTLRKALDYGKWLASRGDTDFCVWVTTNACNAPRYTAGTGKINTKEKALNAEGLWIYRFKQDSDGNGIIDPDMTFCIEGQDQNGNWYLGESDGETKGALRLRRQGTSTADGTKGNIRWDLRANCIIRKFNSNNQTFYGGDIDGENVFIAGKKAELFYIPNINAAPCFIVTAKKNVNESTHTRNVPTARWVEACTRALATDPNYIDVLTPPQRAELETIKKVYPTLSNQEQIAKIKTRQTIDGIPSLGFEITLDYNQDGTFNSVLDPSGDSSNVEFVGQYDLTTDKKNMKVFGFGGHWEWIEEDNKIKTKWVKDNGTETYIGNDGSDDITSKSEDFSIEYKSNTLEPKLSAFKSQNFNRDNINDHFEYRFPEDINIVPGTKPNATPSIGMEQAGPMQALYDFVMTCDNKKDIGAYAGIYYYNGAQFTGNLPLIDGTTTDDTVTNRNNKFKAELKYYAVVNQLLLYYITSVDTPLGVDQEAKNIFMGRFGDKPLYNYKGDGDSTINVPGDIVTYNGVARKILRILGYDYDTNWSIDNDNNFKFIYTEMYEDHNFDAGGSTLWDLVLLNFRTEIQAMKRKLYGTYIGKEAVLRYMFTQHINKYNSLQYNLNSEYCYMEKPSDYSKSHGSAREHIEWFVEGRLRFISGLDFNPPSSDANDLNSDFAGNYFGVYPTQADTLPDAQYKNMLGFFKDDAINHPTSVEKRFGIKVTGYERTNIAIAKGRPATSFNNAFVNVTPNVDGNNIITGYTRQEVTVKLSDLYIPGSSDNGLWLYGCKQIKTIEGLEKWYISQIVQWGDLINCEKLVLGNMDNILDPEGNEVPYENPNLTSLNIHDGDIFGSCKELNLAGCSELAQLSLLAFPVLEKFEGRHMPNTILVTLPVGASLKEAHFSSGLTTFTCDNKPNLTILDFENYESITQLNCSNSSQIVARQVISMLKDLM